MFHKVLLKHFPILLLFFQYPRKPTNEFRKTIQTLQYLTKSALGPILPNVIFEERLNGKFSEIAVGFNFEGGWANLANPTNFSGTLPDSPDSTRFRKL
jgi:hypothetical protein